MADKDNLDAALESGAAVKIPTSGGGSRIWSPGRGRTPMPSKLPRDLGQPPAFNKGGKVTGEGGCYSTGGKVLSCKKFG
jgi:hypothetical protein